MLYHIRQNFFLRLSDPEAYPCVCLLQYMKDILSMGPPVYFVVKAGMNYSDWDAQNLICGGQGCNPDSMSTYLFRAHLAPEGYLSSFNITL